MKCQFCRSVVLAWVWSYQSRGRTIHVSRCRRVGENGIVVVVVVGGGGGGRGALGSGGISSRSV